MKLRMKERENRKKYMLYPEDTIKGYWDLIISLVLILTCSITPYAIAFIEEQDQSLFILDLIIDVLFAIDIIVIFNSAFYDADFQMIDDYGVIAVNYLKGWFFLDFLAVFPFNIMISSSNNINEMARIFRIGRLYKLLKLLRLVRVLKIIKQSNKIMKLAGQLLKISSSFERIFFFSFSSFLLLHIFACLWVFFSQLAPEG